MRERKARKRLSKTLPLMTWIKRIFDDQENDLAGTTKTYLDVACHVSIALQQPQKLSEEPSVKKDCSNGEINHADAKANLRPAESQSNASSGISTQRRSHEHDQRFAPGH
jgi:hypothetical protein